MPDIKPTVALTNSTVEKMSRHDMLAWVNITVHGQYKKIEELCSGVAYCQMMELLFPNTVGNRKIKCNAKLEHEFLHNLKLFQAAFTKVKIDKSVPIDRLIKGKFQDNFEFLQWFKKFFDSHSAGKENLKIPVALAAAQNPAKRVRKMVRQATDVTVASAKNVSSKTDKLKTPKNEKQHDERTFSPSSLKVLEETKQQLAEQMLSIELERNTYYKKLAAIETIIKESINSESYVEWCTRALTILYAVDENISISEEQGAAEDGVQMDG